MQKPDLGNPGSRRPVGGRLSAEHRVVAVLQLPPPITGLSAVNARMVAAMEEAGILAAAVDVAPSRGATGAKKLISRVLRTMRAMFSIAAARSEGGSVLYMPLDGGLGNVLNLALLITARCCGYSVWTHHHSFAYVNRHSTLVAWLLHLAPRGMGHVFLCQEMLDKFTARYSGAWAARDHHGMVLSNAFVVEPAPLINRRRGVFTMGHLSNLTVEKGAVRFINLFIALRRAGVAIEARLAGPIGDAATAEAVESAVRDYPGTFRWLGPLYGEDKAAFYDGLDAFVFPSFYANEAQPVVLLEALAHGAAIVTTDRGCMGCDHASSPGLTATEADFATSAYAWLADHCEAAARETLPLHARALFLAMRKDAEQTVAALVRRL